MIVGETGEQILKLVSNIILLASIGNLAQIQVSCVRQYICKVALKSDMIKEFLIVHPAEKIKTAMVNVPPTARL